MTKFDLSLSIVVLNNDPNKLLELVSFLRIKNNLVQQMELIVLTEYLPSIQAVLRQISENSQQKLIKFRVIHDCFKINDYSALIDSLTSDITILIQTSHKPHPDWLETILQNISTSTSSNIVMGKIIPEKSEDFATQSYLEICKEQIFNLAIKTDFLKRLKLFPLLNFEINNNYLIGRLVRELESEICYCDEAIVCKH